MDFHKHVYNHQPGPCHHVPGIDIGSEDMEELTDGLILITSGLHVFNAAGPAAAYKGRRGSIKLFDFGHPEKAETLTLEATDGFDPDTFQPHGLTSWTDSKSGAVYVFVVNHLPNSLEVVERFQFDAKRRVLKHLETFPPTEDVYYLNDLVAVGPRSFYYSNYQYFIDKPLCELELVAGFRWAGVGYYDGESGKTKLVHTGMLIANGISKSPDGRFIYVSHIGDRSISVFRRNSDNSLTHEQEFKLYTGVDNLHVSSDGKYIWAAGHPVTWQIVEHMKDPVNIAPSQVLRLTLEEGFIISMQEVLMDDGRLLSGSTIAVHRRGQMIVGTINNKALLCEVRHL